MYHKTSVTAHYPMTALKPVINFRFDPFKTVSADFQHFQSLWQNCWNFAKVETKVIFLNSSPPGAIYLCCWTGSALMQIMACRLFSAKSLPEPMPTCCQLNLYEQSTVKFESKYKKNSFKNVHLKMSSAKWRTFCAGGRWINTTHCQYSSFQAYPTFLDIVIIYNIKFLVFFRQASGSPLEIFTTIDKPLPLPMMTAFVIWQYQFPIWQLQLTHWDRVTHICVSKLTSIGSDNGLLPGRRQAIIWTNAGILLIGPLGTNFI